MAMSRRLLTQDRRGPEDGADGGGDSSAESAGSSEDEVEPAPTKVTAPPRPKPKAAPAAPAAEPEPSSTDAAGEQVDLSLDIGGETKTIVVTKSETMGSVKRRMSIEIGGGVTPEQIDALLLQPTGTGKEAMDDDATVGEALTPGTRISLPSRSGAVDCQYKGRRKFYKVHLELEAGRLTFTDPGVAKGAQLRQSRAMAGVASTGILRTAFVMGCTVGVSKSKRKGHPYAVRLDLSSPDTKGESTYVFSMSSIGDMTAWTDCLSKYSGIRAEDVDRINSGAASLGRFAYLRHSKDQPYTVSICPSDVYSTPCVVEVKAACLSEFAAAIQAALGLEDEVKIHSHDEDFGDFVELEAEAFLQLQRECRVELHEVGEAI